VSKWAEVEGRERTDDLVAELRDKYDFVELGVCCDGGCLLCFYFLVEGWNQRSRCQAVKD
jgi:hypothetical protein